jgi:hypothetical protein
MRASAWTMALRPDSCPVPPIAVTGLVNGTKERCVSLLNAKTPERAFFACLRVGSFPQEIVERVVLRLEELLGEVRRLIRVVVLAGEDVEVRRVRLVGEMSEVSMSWVIENPATRSSSPKLTTVHSPKRFMPMRSHSSTTKRLIASASRMSAGSQPWRSKLVSMPQAPLL